MGLTMINSSVTLTRAVLSQPSLAGTDRGRIKDSEGDSTSPFQETLLEGGKKGKAGSGLSHRRSLPCFKVENAGPICIVVGMRKRTGKIDALERGLRKVSKGQGKVVQWAKELAGELSSIPRIWR